MRPDPEDIEGSIEDLDRDAVTVTVEDGLYVARDDETGISSQGQTEAAALANLAASLDVYAEGKTGGEENGEGSWL